MIVERDFRFSGNANVRGLGAARLLATVAGFVSLNVITFLGSVALLNLPLLLPPRNAPPVLTIIYPFWE